MMDVLVLWVPLQIRGCQRRFYVDYCTTAASPAPCKSPDQGIINKRESVIPGPQQFRAWRQASRCPGPGRHAATVHPPWENPQCQGPGPEVVGDTGITKTWSCQPGIMGNLKCVRKEQLNTVIKYGAHAASAYSTVQYSNSVYLVCTSERSICRRNPGLHAAGVELPC